MDLSVYVLTDPILSKGRSQAEVVRAAIAGGATAIQMREKEANTRTMIEIGQELREITREAGVLFIVNDRVDVALAVEADGIHVGQKDMPAALVRKLVGPKMIVGVSASTIATARQAVLDGADYIGVGAIFPTGSKADAGAACGPGRIREIRAEVSIPIVGIGGINIENAAQVMEAGADGVSVISAVVSAPDITAATRQLAAAVHRRS